MPKKLLLSDLGGEPSGFVLATVLAAVALIASVFVAIGLPKMHSFWEIATPSALTILFGFLGAWVAVATSHRIDRDEGPQSQL